MSEVVIIVYKNSTECVSTIYACGIKDADILLIA
jgi:hypothetical protein